jgi:hypothetical protein
MMTRDMIARFSWPVRHILFALALTVPACSFGKPDITTVPAHPTYSPDVHDLLADHCLLCHSFPATRGAPTNFRLDVYKSPDGLPAAYQESSKFIHSIQQGDMPPAALWGDGMGPNGKLLLQNWANDGSPE